jgi:hypothetical protein
MGFRFSDNCSEMEAQRASRRGESPDREYAGQRKNRSAHHGDDQGRKGKTVSQSSSGLLFDH